MSKTTRTPAPAAPSVEAVGTMLESLTANEADDFVAAGFDPSTAKGRKAAAAWISNTVQTRTPRVQAAVAAAASRVAKAEALARGEEWTAPSRAGSALPADHPHRIRAAKAAATREAKANGTYVPQPSAKAADRKAAAAAAWVTRKANAKPAPAKAPAKPRLRSSSEGTGARA